MKPIYVIYSIVNYGNDNDLMMLGYVHDEDKAVSTIKEYLLNEFKYELSSHEETVLGQWGEFWLGEGSAKIGFELLDNLEED